MLFCPANNQKMLDNATKYNPDCIIYDLEDAIAYNEKKNARKMLCESIRKNNYGGCEIFARINALSTEFAEDDIKELVASGIKYIRLPMCETKEDIIKLSNMLTYYEKINNVENGTVKIQGAIETPKGVLNALEIATASNRMVSISFGAEDFTNCLGTERTKNTNQFLYARSHIALCANVAGIDGIDTVFSDFKDIDGFIEEARSSKALGFSGKSCIHPAQVEELHKVYTPTEEQIAQAIKIIEASEKAKIEGIGVITVSGKMIDKPIIEKANKILNRIRRQ